MLVLINLDSALHRRQAMARQLAESGLPAARVGIDMRGVRAADIDAEVRSRFSGLSFDRRALSTPEIGCWLSHLTAWRLLLASNCPCGTIIEDDLVLMPGFADAVRRLSAERPAGQFELIYFGTSSRNVSQRRRTQIGGLAVHRPVGIIFNTWGYNISRSYAERFFAHPHHRIRLPIDHFLGGRGGRARPHIGVLQPAVLREDPVLGAASQIGPHTRRIDRSRLFETVRRRVLASAVSEFYYSLYRYL